MSSMFRKLPLRAGASSDSSHPFKVSYAGRVGGNHKAAITSGRINNLDAVSIGPFSVGDTPQFTVTTGDDHRIYIEIVLSYNNTTGIWSYTSYTIKSVSGVAPSATSTKAYYTLCDVSIDSNNVVLFSGDVAGNIGHERCGNSTSYSDYWWAGA